MCYPSRMRLHTHARGCRTLKHCHESADPAAAMCLVNACTLSPTRRTRQVSQTIGSSLWQSRSSADPRGRRWHLRGRSEGAVIRCGVASGGEGSGTSAARPRIALEVGGQGGQGGGSQASSAGRSGRAAEGSDGSPGTCGAMYCSTLTELSMWVVGRICRAIAARPSSVKQKSAFRTSHLPSPNRLASLSAASVSFSRASVSSGSCVIR